MGVGEARVLAWGEGRRYEVCRYRWMDGCDEVAGGYVQRLLRRGIIGGVEGLSGLNALFSGFRGNIRIRSG